MLMWHYQTTPKYEDAALRFVHTHVSELNNLYINLHHYRSQLLAATNPKSVEAKYLHKETDQIMSLDQQTDERESESLGPENLVLYVFPDYSNRILCLLAVGKASDKHADMEYCISTIQ